MLRAHRYGFRSIIAAVIILVVGAAAIMLRDAGRIYPNVFIAGNPLAGLDREQARRVIAQAGAPRPDRPITVRVGDGSYGYLLRDTGVSFSVERALDRASAVGRTGPLLRQLGERAVSYRRRTNILPPPSFNANQARRFAEACARRFNRPPANASVEVEGREISITPGKPGIRVEIERAAGAISNWAERGCREDLRLPARMTGATVTADQLKEVDTVLAAVSTALGGSSRNRRHNVARAAAAADGFILMPGEVFSYNEVVGPRTEETGYRTAPVIRGGKLVPGTGGGACQLSSTLYQTALRAGLQKVRRSHHSQPVHYTPAGLDATVVYGAIDLKFRNSTDHLIVLRARVTGGRLTCQALGHGPAPAVALVRRVQGVEPPEPLVIADRALAAGARVIAVKPRRGLRVRVLRAIGGAEAELISNDYYPYERGLIKQGAVASSPPPPPAGEVPPAPAALLPQKISPPPASDGVGGAAAEVEKNSGR